ncbi:MAG: hypothetical protein GVY02_10335 [Bacteroidetes bacterium]|jgi:ABC-type transport system substrate-binding protein|nr:hypothetical protein [Bacteroidota bacterium]
MKNIYLNKVFLLLFSIVLLSACGSSENTVVVVEETPETEEAATSDTTAPAFSELTIGILDPVTNFDPLFAENLSTQRVITLIYEGLYTLDRNGNPIAQLVDQVEVSDDSLEYVFTLKQNRFFHNSPVFSAGIGRRLQAGDVKIVFERAAQSGFPKYAAKLLMNIAGFENYYLEQRHVYDPDNRVLGGVNGIQVLDRNRVRFVLDEKDPEFLMKLASPYLSIYPGELALNGGEELRTTPVGTGPYQLSRAGSENGIILNQYNSNQRGNPDRDVSVDRIEFRYFQNESELYSEFASGEIDWIPEIGPEISEQVLTADQTLSSSFEGVYQQTGSNASRITAFYLNDDFSKGVNWLKNRLAYLTAEDFQVRGNINLQVSQFEVFEEAVADSAYYISHTDDHVALAVLNDLNALVFQPETTLALLDIHVPTRQTAIYTRNSDSVHQQFRPIPGDYWLNVETRIIGLHHDQVNGISSSSAPWLLHIDEISVDESVAQAGGS